MKALLLAAALAAAAGFKGKGFSLPDGAVKVDDDRYRLSQTWEEALRWYKGVYPPAKYPRKTLHSQTSVRAVHIDNPQGGEWDGANLYEAGRGEVRVFVLTGKEPAPKDPAK
jgi:hypothetical protein